MSNSLWPHGLYSLPGSSVHGDSPGKNVKVGCHDLLRRSSSPRGSTLYSLCNVLIFLCLWKFSLLSTLLYLILTYAFILLFSKYPCHYWVSWAFLVAQTVRNPLALGRPGFNPWVGKIPWRRTWESVFLPGEFHGQRNLVGYSPWGHKESGTA